MTAYGRLRIPGKIDPLAMTERFKSLVLAASPWGYWPMNDGSGSTFVDQSGNGNNGTLTSATWNTTGSPANEPYVSFAGSGYGVVPYAAALNTQGGAFTAEACFRTSTAPSAAPNSAGIMYRDVSSLETWGMEIRATLAVNGYIYKGSSQYDDITSSANVWSLGVWNHLVLTKAAGGGTVNVYLNGVLVGTDPTSADVASNTSAALYFGASSSTTKRGVVSMCRCAFYLSELSAGVVSDHYAAMTL